MGRLLPILPGAPTWRAWSGLACLLGMAVCAATTIGAPLARAQAPTAPVKIDIPARAGTAGGPLTIETARPLPVPPPPGLRTPGRVTTPPRFVAPDVREAPPPPEIVAIAPVPPPPEATGTPEVPAILSSPPQIGPPIDRPAEAPAATAALPPAPPPGPVAPPSAALQQDPAPPAPPADTRLPDGPLRVVFAGAEPDIPPAAAPMLAAVAARLLGQESLRLQLRSYASGTEDSTREARQLSLARALALRERLTAYGVRSTRIDIRALGREETPATTGQAGAPLDRIDVEFINE